MILTPSQRRIFEKGIAAANEVLPTVEYFERIVEDVPHIKERVEELKVRRDYLSKMCESCIAADRMIG